VEWFNSVDATYRADLRELNELNFARFDAKLEQRLAELRAELRVSLAEVRAGMAALESGFDSRLEAGEARVPARMDTRLTEVRTDMVHRMFAAWSSMMLVLLGLLFAVLRSS